MGRANQHVVSIDSINSPEPSPFGVTPDRCARPYSRNLSVSSREKSVTISLSYSRAITASGCRSKEPVMFLSEIVSRRAVAGAMGAGAVT